MKEDNKKKLNSELRYLLKEEREKELLKYDAALDDKNVNITNISKEIYKSRGMDYSMLKKGFFNNLTENISDLGKVFQNKDSKVRSKMIVEIIFMVLLLILLKIPFDLIRDIGYDYIDILSNNQTFEQLWELGFLVLYTITLICTFLVLIRNFNKKYK